MSKHTSIPAKEDAKELYFRIAKSEGYEDFRHTAHIEVTANIWEAIEFDGLEEDIQEWASNVGYDTDLTQTHVKDILESLDRTVGLRFGGGSLTTENLEEIARGYMDADDGLELLYRVILDGITWDAEAGCAVTRDVIEDAIQDASKDRGDLHDYDFYFPFEHIAEDFFSNASFDDQGKLKFIYKGPNAGKVIATRAEELTDFEERVFFGDLDGMVKEYAEIVAKKVRLAMRDCGPAYDWDRFIAEAARYHDVRELRKEIQNYLIEKWIHKP
jgi:hypothetical protein